MEMNQTDVTVKRWQYVLGTVRHSAHYDCMTGLSDVIVT